MAELSLRSLQGKTTAEKLEIAGRWAGADGSVMDGIWRTESGRGQNMRSSAGARGHFQIMPRELGVMSERLGMAIDPDNFDQALLASAHMLRENLQHFGNLPDALRAYNGGWRRSNWNNPETAAYVGKVLGGDATNQPASGEGPATPPAALPQEPALDVSTLDPRAVLSGQVRPTGPTIPGVPGVGSLSAESVLAGTPGDYGNYRAPPARRLNTQASENLVQGIAGFAPLANPDQLSNVGILEVGQSNSSSVVRQAREDSVTGMDRFSTAVRLNTITGNLIDAIDRNIPDRDPDFDYEANMAVIEEGRSRTQRDELRERATSLEGAMRMRELQDKETQRREIVGDGLLINLAAGVIDPAGFLLGGGIGKALQATGVGSRVLFGQGARAAGTASIVAEGVAGNVAGTAIIDRIAGVYQTPEDYAINGLFGGLMSAAAIPLVSRGALREARRYAPAPATTDPAFSQWFGNSVLKDSRGQPTRVYHGTSADIAEWDASGDKGSAGITGGHGIYFTADPVKATAYARRSAEANNTSPRIYPAYVSLQNPLILEVPRNASKRQIHDVQVQSSYLTAERVQELQSQGYDGIINRASDEIVVFAPEQVRSAVTAGGWANGAAQDLAAAVEQHEADILAEAVTRVGPNAEAPEVQAAASAVRQERITSVLNGTKADNAGDLMLFRPEEPDSFDPVARQARLAELGGEALSDDTQRTLVAQLIENADRIVANADLGEDVGGQVLNRIGMASTGETMLRSNDNVLKATAIALTESTTGRAGRHQTASLTQAMTERRFMRPILEYEDHFHIYRRSKGVGWMRWALGDGDIRRQFDAEVATELRARSRPDLYPSSSTEAVRKAADNLSAGYKMMGEEQIRAGTLGSANITPGDPSYFPQRVSGAKLQRLTEPQKAAFRGIIAEQARTIFGWDKKFADSFGKRYLETAIDRTAGNYDVPITLTHQTSSDYVDDLLEAMRAGASKEDIVRIDKASQKFARGGPNFTKARLNFDVMHSYKLPDGTSVSLMDIMDTDMVGLYRSYARRASGEIALNQFGIAGSHGLKTIRGYLKVAFDAKRITNDELMAFDQVAAEFLNTPFGKHQGAFMDNLRIITSVVKLGGMGITQFGEYGNGIAVLGATRVMTSIKDIPRLMKEVGEIRKGSPVHGLLSSIERQQGFEVGLDSWIMTRALDIKDNDVQQYGREGLGLGDRVVRGASHAQAILSGHRIISAVQTRGMSEQIIHKAMSYVRSGTESKALSDMGFSPELISALKANLDKIAKFDGDTVKHLDIFAGDLTPAQRIELVGAINRGANQIIQNTYIGETGKWAHDGLLKLLFQFRTFSLTAVEKQWGRNLRNYGALKSMMFLMGAMSFAAPLHMARVHARMLGMPEEDRETYAEKYLSPQAIAQATMTYASAAGFAGDIWDIGGSAATNIMGDAAPEWLSDTVNPRGGARSQGRLLGGAVLPSAGIAEDAFSLANGDLGKLKSLMPGANLPYVVPFLNALEAQQGDD
jgi:hypothetical protein